MIERLRRRVHERTSLQSDSQGNDVRSRGLREKRKHRGFTRNVPIFAWLLVGLTLLAAAPVHAQHDDGSPLELESKVPLGAVNGRIDHLAFDLSRKQVFIAELQNNSVGVVDLGSGRLLHRITGLSEPQGVGYVPSADMLFVANGGDGTVRVFKGGDFMPTGLQALNSDADNVRVDAETAHVYVGYGAGALAVIDPATRMKIKDIELPAHPESFQINRTTRQIFVNLPNAGSIVVLGNMGDAPQATWSTANDQGNFAMTLDEENQRVLVVFRNPPKLSVRDMRTGAVIAEHDTCGDVDDIFVDPKRRRVYVTCGEGFIDVLTASADYPRVARITTRRGARTSLFIPPLDRLAVAARATGSEPAELWIYRPTP
jgi:DNA-binding beta-propeller fold protein YncE